MLFLSYYGAQSNSDPFTTSLLKECLSVLVPTVTNTGNLSVAFGQFHPIIKEYDISPLLKKPILDYDQLSNIVFYFSWIT